MSYAWHTKKRGGGKGLFVMEGLKQVGDLGFDVGDGRVNKFGEIT